MVNENNGKSNCLIFLNPKDKKHFLLAGTKDGVDHFYRFDKEERKKLLKGSVDVEWLSYHSSGIALHFYSDTTHLVIKGKNQPEFDMNNMTYAAQAGFALYYFDPILKIYRHHNTVRFPRSDSQYEVNILGFENKEYREYILYFPLYIGVEELVIGVDKDAKTLPYIFNNKKKVAIYGTSITQGCSASQSGLAYTNVISRNLDVEVFNMGFSGNANLQNEVAEVLALRKFDILVMDVEPNCGMNNILKERICSFLDTYFSLLPKGKIMYFSRYKVGEDVYKSEQDKLRLFYYEYIPQIIKNYQDKGYDISYIDGRDIIKDNELEYSPDALHPDSFAMSLIAKKYIEELKKVL